MFLQCWPTLLAASRDPLDTVVHDDGSLTPREADQIAAVVPRCRIVWRGEADARMAAALASAPAAEAFRRGSVWGLKLLDVVLVDDEDTYYVDADIRFFRPFSGLFTPQAIAHGPFFLRDTVWAAYSVRPWHLGAPRALRLSQAINTGLTLIRRSDYDLEFVNWFLRQPDWRVIPAWVEPTCWSALAARIGGRAVSSAQVVNLYPGARVTPATVGAHFLSAYRRQFESWLTLPVDTGAPVEVVRTERLGELGPVALGLNQLKRKLTNEWRRRAASREASR